MCDEIKRAKELVPSSVQEFTPVRKQELELCLQKASSYLLWPGSAALIQEKIEEVSDVVHASEAYVVEATELSSHETTIVPSNVKDAQMDMCNGADIHERLDSLKHLGGSYSMTGKGSYSCDVTVYNYTSMVNRTPHTWKTTVSWDTGDGNLESALIRKLGSASKWSITYTGADGQKYNSFMYLQANVQDDLENYETRDDVMLHVYF